MSNILVTGASGFVGSHVLPELLGAGHRVVALVRTQQAGEKVARRVPANQVANLEVRTGDVDRPGTLVPALAGVDAVVHLAAIPRDWNGGRRLLAVNLDGTRNVIAAMQAAGVRRLVHLGALGVEDRKELHYAKSKARAERAVMDSGLDWTILKPSLLFGPGDGSSRFQPLHVADLALCVRLSLERPDTIGHAYELGGPRTWTYREIAAEVCRATGRRRVILGMPVPLIALVAGAAEAVHVPFPVATDQLRQLALDNVGPVDGVHSAFGFVPRRMEGELLYLRRRKAQQAQAR